MKTTIEIDGEKILINGKPSYEGIEYKGHSIEGLIMNSRMIQAITDDENPVTRRLWVYPDTNIWDPERNTNEFCKNLPEYRKYGLLGITVGLQGGGSIYEPSVWNNCEMSAFKQDGSLKKDWLNRLLKVLETADSCGIVVIVNYFYWKNIRLIFEKNIIKAVETATDWLLRTGFKNILVDIANECGEGWKPEICRPSQIHKLINIAKSITLNNRRLLVGCSTGGDNLQTEEWLESEDIFFPHGNGNTPEILKQRLTKIRQTSSYKKRPRPLIINEDGVDLLNLEAAIESHASWGFYAQGKGSQEKIYEKIFGEGEREKDYSKLSGFQTLPVNWSINTDKTKILFFNKIKEITCS